MKAFIGWLFLCLFMPVVIKVAILNGNGESGIATKFEEEVVARMEKWQVIKKDNAKKLYEKTQIIDVNNTLGRTALTLANELGGEVALLPEGEEKGEADLLIIVGQNWP